MIIKRSNPNRFPSRHSAAAVRGWCGLSGLTGLNIQPVDTKAEQGPALRRGYQRMPSAQSMA
jgi:hypothetical protein